MRLSVLPFVLPVMLGACARNWVNYPPIIAYDSKGGSHIVSARAAEFNGSDINGGTEIAVSNHGIHISATGGINNSISTAEGYRTARYGAGAAALVGGIGIAAHAAQVAYGANQTATATSNVAASKAAAEVGTAKIGAAVQQSAIKAGLNAIPR